MSGECLDLPLTSCGAVGLFAGHKILSVFYKNEFLITALKMKKNKWEQTSIKPRLNIIGRNHKWETEKLQKKKKE